MKKRDLYLNQLTAFRDKSLVKVITGVRRCGKSSLLDLFEKYLLDSKVDSTSIIRMNFESLDFDEIKDYNQLHQYIKSRLTADGKTYILLDEIQLIEQWEKAVNSLRLDPNVDLYVTGSNAYLLSSELSTLLSGRYVEIKMLPLSFKEYLDFNDFDVSNDVSLFFENYIEYGGFPGISELRDYEPSIKPFLNGIYNTIIMKDVINRNAIRDTALFENLVRFMAGNIGNPVSTKKISDYLTSAGRKTNSETIENYLKMLENAFILYRVGRYDLKGKQYLKTHGKYYFVDLGMRNELIGKRGADYGSILENVVYFELLRRGYEVAIGRFDNLEVDFVATKSSETIYYQVTATMLTKETSERELRPLQSIPDNYGKVILSMDRTPFKDYDGIRNENLLDFLLAD